MTTVAWKDGVIACDKQATSGSTRHRAPYKMIRRERFVYVVVGAQADGTAAVDCIDGGKPDDRSADANDYTIFQMCRRTGRLWEWYSSGAALPVLDRFHACGSGRDLALGAMAAGATPAEAVRIAAAWDVYTGFGVQVFASDKARRSQKLRK